MESRATYDYTAGRNDGWSHAESLQRVGPVVGSNDELPGGERYLQGFSDGVELFLSERYADGSPW